MPSVKPIPEGYPRVMPHLTIAGAAEAIDFYKTVFGADERMRMAMPDGTIAHAEIAIGDSIIMIGDEGTGTDPSPKTVGGSPVSVYVYVENVDEVFKRAMDSGATSQESAPEDRFYGDRTATFVDPYGHQWNIATHVEDVPPEEMEQRAAAAMT